MEYVALAFSYLDPFTITFLKALALSIFLGYVMGAERELRRKDAGISTNMFVICGSMIFTLLSMTVDPASESRIAAQIIPGIGFLGAGLIFKEGATVRNLTTAASIWYAGALGMLIGFGYYQVAFIAGIAGIIIPRVRHFRSGPDLVEFEPEKKPTKKNPTTKPKSKKKSA